MRPSTRPPPRTSLLPAGKTVSSPHDARRRHACCQPVVGSLLRWDHGKTTVRLRWDYGRFSVKSPFSRLPRSSFTFGVSLPLRHQVFADPPSAAS